MQDIFLNPDSCLRGLQILKCGSLLFSIDQLFILTGMCIVFFATTRYDKSLSDKMAMKHVTK